MHGARRPAWIARAAGALALGLLVAGCAPPVGVRRVSPRTVSADLTRSALNSSQPSLFSQNVLERRNLADAFRRSPDDALQRLYAAAIRPDASSDDLFALAELPSHTPTPRSGATTTCWRRSRPGHSSSRPVATTRPTPSTCA